MGLSQYIGASAYTKPGVIDNTAARPASPYEGQVIYQKDTDELLAYNGTSWTRPWNMPWGVVSFTESTTPPSNFTTEAVMITGASFTAVANRYYKVTYFEPDPASVTATSWLAFRIRLTNLAGTLKQQGYVQLPTSGVTNAMASVIWIGTLSAGTTNFVGTLQSTSGTAGCDRSSIMRAFITVEDIGPA